jgi:hypothetical protein
MYARARLAVNRIAVVDWDVHHGNGTQLAFYENTEVLTISIHQDNLYPLGSGSISDNGSGPGAGSNLNIPMPPGSGVGSYLAAFERVIVPALYRFKPELIVVASGLDANAYDPLGRMMLHSESYRRMTNMLMQAASDLCAGRLVLAHEGGYAETYVPFCGLAIVEELTGLRTEVGDPYLEWVQSRAYQELQPIRRLRSSERACSCPASGRTFLVGPQVARGNTPGVTNPLESRRRRIRFFSKAEVLQKHSLRREFDIEGSEALRINSRISAASMRIPGTCRWFWPQKTEGFRVNLRMSMKPAYYAMVFV